MSYRIADAHAHIFPDKIAQKAAQSIGGFYSMPMEHVGSVEALLASGQQIGVEKYLVFSTATKPEQAASINRFIHDACAAHPAFIGLGTLHPLQRDAVEEVERIAGLGLLGVKLHPDFQQFCVDDRQMYPVYDAMAQHRLWLLCHSGDKRYSFSNPGRLARVARDFPQLRIIAPHFGGWSEWEEAARTLGLPNVYYDTSSSLLWLSEQDVRRIFRSLPPSRFFFGTDFPMWDHGKELDRLLGLGLGEETTRAILWDNFERAFLSP